MHRHKLCLTVHYTYFLHCVCTLFSTAFSWLFQILKPFIERVNQFCQNSVMTEQSECTVYEKTAVNCQHKKFLTEITVYQWVERQHRLSVKLKFTVNVDLLILDQLKSLIRMQKDILNIFQQQISFVNHISWQCSSCTCLILHSWLILDKSVINLWVSALFFVSFLFFFVSLLQLFFSESSLTDFCSELLLNLLIKELFLWLLLLLLLLWCEKHCHCFFTV